ncbi:MAG TPA: GNAT family N-acetyltransferase [Gammaproteobacteria bacterium]|nr:GNAT family N-acetyltransferase [Gammaproteobacteria bacterium]
MDDFFSSPQWFDAWIKAFAAEAESRSLSVADNVFPFLVERTAWFGLPLCCLRAPANEHSPFFSFPLDRLEGNFELAKVLRHSRRQFAWDWLQLELVPWDSAIHRAVVALEQQGWPVLEERHPHTAMIDIKGDWEDYAAGGMSKKLRANTNRAENGLKRQGDLLFEECASRPDWEHCLASIFNLEAQGWKGDGDSAINCKPLERRFYTDVLQLARERNALRLYTLRLDGDMIAANIMIIDAETAYGWKTTYRQDLAKFSPGNVLQRYILRALYEQADVKCLDMLDPVTDWKRRWASRVEPRAFVRIFAPTIKGRMMCYVAKRRAMRQHNAEPN